jgi:hypothetical protein
MKDKISDALKTKELVELCEANGYEINKKNQYSLTHKVRVRSSLAKGPNFSKNTTPQNLAPNVR